MSAKFQAIFAHAKAESEKRDKDAVACTKREIIALAMHGRVYDAEPKVVEIFPESEGLKVVIMKYEAPLREAFKEDGMDFRVFRATSVHKFSVSLREI